MEWIRKTRSMPGLWELYFERLDANQTAVNFVRVAVYVNIRTQLEPVCISAMMRKELVLRLVITTLTFTGSLLLVESAGVLPVKVAVVELVDVSFSSTGGVPSAEVIESVVTLPVVAGLITSPSSGISVFC